MLFLSTTLCPVNHATPRQPCYAMPYHVYQTMPCAPRYSMPTMPYHVCQTMSCPPRPEFQTRYPRPPRTRLTTPLPLLQHFFLLKLLVGCKRFHEEIPIEGVVSDIMNNITFLRHMTSIKSKNSKKKYLKLSNSNVKLKVNVVK